MKKLNAGCYLTDDGIIVAWQDDILIVYPFTPYDFQTTFTTWGSIEPLIES